MRIVEGLDIPVSGTPEQAISDGPEIATVALLGNDYVGMRASLRVQHGDRVRLGQPLFTDRKHTEIAYTSPGAGIVSAINRGDRRALLSIVIHLEGEDEESFESFNGEQLVKLDREQVKQNLLSSGLWTALRTRPYSKVADPNSSPHSIFVTAINTEPLAPRPELMINEYRDAFAHGLTVISKLTEGAVFLCKSPGVELPIGDSGKISVVDFAGPHPSGLVGTHIHFLDPVSIQKLVWHLNYQDVIAIGNLFTTGRLWTERIVAIAGPMVKQPRLVRTRIGADTDELTQGEIVDEPARVISGSVLSGRWSREPQNFLGRYHDQVSVIAELSDEAEKVWPGEVRNRFSIYGLFRAKRGSNRGFVFSVGRNGKQTAMVPFGGFEKVMPLDILPTQLLRSLIVGDTETAQKLGCLELDEEDLALCTFVCPGKYEYGL